MHGICHKTTAILLLLTLLGPGLSGSLPAQTGEVTTARPAEYMIYQYADTALVVKIEALETEFDAQITGPERALILDSGVAHRRIGPIFQFVEAEDVSRQLMIKINPARAIERSQISMELIQLSTRERNHKALAHAYRLFSTGIEREHNRDTTIWAAKAYSLRNAAQVFADFGMEEMRLWSEYYSAHLVLYQLNDVLTALEFAEYLQRAAARAGFDLLELAALALETEALVQAASRSAVNESSYLERAYPALQRQAVLAGDLGLVSEKGRALFSAGLVLEQQGDLDGALRRYEQALDVSLASGNQELVNEIRATAAVAYETQGSTSGAIAMLDDIAGDLGRKTSPGLEEEAAFELAENLFEKGRLLNSSYRFAEAAVELSRALQIQQNLGSSGRWGLTGLELGWAQYSEGNWQDAVRTMEAALPRTAREGNQEVLFRSFGGLASIARSRGQHEAVAQLREQQANLPEAQGRRALLLFDQGLDAMSRGRAGMAAARSSLQASREAAKTSGDLLLAHRADLQLCLLQVDQGGSGSCSTRNIQGQLGALRESGIPRLALEAEFIVMKIESRNGRLDAAGNSANRLIEQVDFFQSELPGVLGGWYWENRENILREFLSITLAATLRGGRESANGGRMLLALERVRRVEDFDSLNVAPGGAPRESQRALLARREAARGQQAQSLRDDVSRQLTALRAEWAPGALGLTQNSLATLLSGLDKNSILLTYYFTPATAYALVGKSGGVRIIRLQGARDLPGQLEELTRQVALPDGGQISTLLARIGSALLDPVSKHLADRVYLLAAGALNGVPFDALKLRGDHLARNHEVLMLRSLNALQSQQHALRMADTDVVFLAGDPQASQELFSYGVSTSAEIAAVRDRNIGPGLHIVQGVALQRDEFIDERFSRARLIHMAIPGTVDLAMPERSRISMSRSAQENGPAYLVPADIRGFSYSAGLAVLSGLAVAGDNRSIFRNRLGFTSDFLDAGVDAVISTLVPASDKENADFLGAFYDQLEQQPDIARALRQTRLAWMKDSNDMILPVWARFQLHIR